MWQHWLWYPVLELRRGCPCSLQFPVIPTTPYGLKPAFFLSLACLASWIFELVLSG